MATVRYTALIEELTAAIRSGALPAGTQLPSELHMAISRGISRGVVRAAMAELERAGLVSRARGRGTIVLPRVPSGFGTEVAPLDLFLQFGRDMRRVIRSIRSVTADAALARAISVPEGSRWLLLRTLRIGETGPLVPLAVGESYLHPDLAPVTGHLRDELVPMHLLIERYGNVRTETVDQEAVATTLPEEAALTLVATPGAPALRLLRHYRDAGGWLFLATAHLFPAERFAWRLRLRRREAG
jgi:DNA-binding GntR family transcriptional regulator